MTDSMVTSQSGNANDPLPATDQAKAVALQAANQAAQRSAQATRQAAQSGNSRHYSASRGKGK